MKILVTAENIEIGKKVIDNDNFIGTITECSDIHNVIVEFDIGGSGCYCLVEGCTDKTIINNKEIEIKQYDPLYYIQNLNDMEETIKQLTEGILEILPFSTEEIIAIDVNCGAIWIDVKDETSKLGKKSYNIYVMECEPDTEE